MTKGTPCGVPGRGDLGKLSTLATSFPLRPDRRSTTLVL
jgi:hypothetical protein